MIWPRSTASSGLASVGKVWGRTFQGRGWTGPNENSATVLLREVRPWIASVCKGAQTSANQWQTAQGAGVRCRRHGVGNLNPEFESLV